jgi:cysteine synthase B
MNFPSIKRDTKASSNILERIGNTPMVHIRTWESIHPGVKIMAKAEWFNPGGSVKDRPALRMIEDAERSGELTKKKTILDSSSGNTGVSYAMIGAIKGYEVEVVIPANASSVNISALKAHGAKIHLSDPLEGSDGAIRLARSIFEGDVDRYYMPDQYNNPSNWKAHFDTTAPEIWQQTGGEVTHLVAGIGTGGTIIGTGRGLRRFCPKIRIIGVQPDNALHGIEGLKFIRESIVPGIFDENEIDEMLFVSTEEAYQMVQTLASREGLFVGPSSGAAMVGALKIAMKIKRGVIIAIFPDGGWKHAIDRTKKPVADR